MIGALFYLRTRTLKNRVLSRLRRFKEPKYLIGGIAGLLYFYTFFFRNVFAGHAGRGNPGTAHFPEEFRSVMELGMTWVLLIIVAVLWIIPSRRGALDFTEAEIQFLFPAPVSRRGLLHFKLLSWQMGLLFSSLMVTLFTGRLFRAEGAIPAIVGWWFTLLLIQLHSLGASFTREHLLKRGVSHNLRRWVIGGALLAVIGVAAWWTRQRLPPAPPFEDWDFVVVRGWITAVSDTAPLSWLLLPMRWVTRVTMVRSPVEFLYAFIPVFLMAVAHYFWVIHANVAFEEASVEHARLTAERLAAARGKAGGRRPARSRGRHSTPFELRPLGPPWVAIGWKNLIAAGSIVRPRTFLRVAIVLAVACLFGGRLLHDQLPGAIVTGVVSALLAISIIVGPNALRFDLRHDLAAAPDVLKVLPLSGRQVVMGELLAPWAMLSVAQIFLAFAAASFLPSAWIGGDGMEIGRRLAVFVAAVLLAPTLSLMGFCLQNLAVLMFPAWILVSPGQGRGGFEVMGQQLIVLAGQALAFVAVAIPPLIAAAAVFGLFAWGLGPWIAAVPAAAVAAAGLVAEAAGIIVLLGRLWDRTDLSLEQVP